ncbi:MAG TPA: hypothetical protein VF591_28690 [Pyrinomonadaceae bacterium]|jgi:hypothetical protein
MSRVATAQGQASQTVPEPLREFWRLMIQSSSLTGKLKTLQIMAQLPVPVALSVNRLSGNVWTVDDKTVYGMLRGQTMLAGPDEQQQQTVSFEILVNGELYTFGDGVLSFYDGDWHIDGGAVSKNPPGFEDDTLVEDGTWSAQATSGPPTEKPRRGRGRGDTERHRP